MMRTRGRRSQGGFTLVELLTVIAIIIVLAGFIMTAVLAAQEGGRHANCSSNLRQLHSLIINYTQTYGGYLPSFWHERWVGELGLVGKQWGSLPHDMSIGYYKSGGATRYGRLPKEITVCYNILSPSPWNEWAAPNEALYVPLYRSGAAFLLCKSDYTGYRCDQGCLVSYMGLAKYGWWHRGSSIATAVNNYFVYVQLQEIENPMRSILLTESEPYTWLFGNCGCRWHVYEHPAEIVQRHFGGGNILHFDGQVRLAKTAHDRQIETWEPRFQEVHPGW